MRNMEQRTWNMENVTHRLPCSKFPVPGGDGGVVPP